MHINIAKINFKPIGINIAKVDFSLHDVTNYQDEYLTLSALEGGEITITIPSAVNATYATSLSYSKDKSNWTETVVDNTAQTITISVFNGDNVYLKGVAKTWYNSDEGSGAHINSSANINVSGNIMSLLYGDNFKDKTTFPEESQYTFGELFNNNTHLINAKNLILPATTLYENCYRSMFQYCASLTTAPALPATTLATYCYYYMFQGCTSLTSAPELPATTLAYGCYTDMFNGCTSLTSAPELPATTLAAWCYTSMFKGCTSLTSAPELPATTLAEWCYSSMFNSCTSLTQAPELPATNLISNCYNSMFRGCQKLSKITMLATNISATSCLNNWVNGVASTGTFTKAASMTSLPTGSSGIPAGWTVVDYGAEPEKDYLCFTSTGDSTVAMQQIGTPNTSANKVIQYKLNGGQWQNWNLSAVTLADGDKMYFKSDDEIPMSESDAIYKKFVMTGSIAASGNVMSLLNFSDTLPSYAFNSLFEYCTSLTTTPELPATTLAERCYFAMFYECTSLTQAPELPAATLAQSCYRSMFYDCSSLTQAPELPAATLVIDCYTYMFYSCKKLSKITMLATNISANSCLNNWVNGVASTGTFTKAASMTSLPAGTSGIPEGWTVVDYGAA